MEEIIVENEIMLTGYEGKGCGVAIINEEGKILMGLRCKIGEPQVYGFPGGTIEAGEYPYNAIRREIKEETGLTPSEDETRFIGSFELNGLEDFIYQCTKFTGEVVAKEDEMKDFAWYTPQEVLNIKAEGNMFDYTARAVEYLADMTTIFD